jgi:hypothetical protein
MKTIRLENIQNEKFVLTRDEMGMLVGGGIYEGTGPGEYKGFKFSADCVIYANEADYKSKTTCCGGVQMGGSNDTCEAARDILFKQTQVEVEKWIACSKE